MTTNTEQSVSLLAASPWFLVEDVAAAAEYYHEVLGFDVDGFFGDPPVFVILSRDRVSICMNQSNGLTAASNRQGSEVAGDAYFYLLGVDELAAELDSRGAEIVEGPVERDYGHRELVVKDLNGFILVFGEPKIG